MADQILAQRNAGPRLNRNLLVFCAASEARLAELRTAARQHLAWKSILEDHQHEKIELTKGDEAQAKSKITETDETVTSGSRDLPACARAGADPGHPRDPLAPDEADRSGQPRRANRPEARDPRSVSSPPTAEPESGWTSTASRCGATGETSPSKRSGRRTASSRTCRVSRRSTCSPGAISDGVSKLDWQTETFAYAEGHDGNRWVGLEHRPARDVLARAASLVRPDVASQQIDADRSARRSSAAEEPDV
jgi:hypothetical protein